MKTMESELQRLDKELYEMYMRSMEIAKLKWLPYIKPRKDSYNSYPHVIGVKNHVDRLLYDEDENEISLNGSELYILLCAILMHDIGKGASEERPSDKNRVPDHAYESYRITLTHWAELGLPTEKVAGIVADICRFHSGPDNVEMEELYTKYYFDQFQRTEPIRGRLLGALLFLGDHMDASFTRTVPNFFKDNEPLDVVGNFRSKIVDVRYDQQYKMVRVILDKSCFDDIDVYAKKKTLQGDLFEYFKHYIKPKRVNKYAKSSALYNIAEDAMHNEQDIAMVKDELNIMGIPVKKWLIECDEQLFRIYQRRDSEYNLVLDSAFALEPIINLDYCLEVLKGICMLSGGIFAQQYFQYSELVNFIREEERKTYKVQCAVRRLALLLKAKDDSNYVIYNDKNNWSFYCKKEFQLSDDANNCDRKDIVFNQLKELIRGRLTRENDK